MQVKCKSICDVILYKAPGAYSAGGLYHIHTSHVSKINHMG